MLVPSRSNEGGFCLVSGHRLSVVPRDACDTPLSSLPQARAETEGHSDKEKSILFFLRSPLLRAGLRRSGNEGMRRLTARLKVDALTRIKSLILSSLLLSTAVVAAEQKKSGPPVNANAAIGAKFEQNVADYMKLRQKALSGLSVPKNTETPSKITEFQKQLSDSIRTLRPQAKQGDIFTPEVAGLFQHLVTGAMRSKDGALIRTSFQRAEPLKGGHLEVNAAYPDGLPLQSMPPSLLLNLPRLPKELEYRFVGRELILRDTQSNLIVDVIPDLTMTQKK
jgi:hypothetical protein